MSDLVGNPEDRFSHNKAHMSLQNASIFTAVKMTISDETFSSQVICIFSYHEKEFIIFS